MITVYEGECFFCKKEANSGEDDSACGFLFIGPIFVSYYHNRCWDEYTCGTEQIEFSSFEKWREFAGDEWCVDKHIWIGRLGCKLWYMHGQPWKVQPPDWEMDLEGI